MTMFEAATKRKLRFNTVRGSVSTEDLWDMSLDNSNDGFTLDAIAKAVNEDLIASGTKSFVRETGKDLVLELKMDILKHIIAVKLNEEKDAVIALENAARKELLMDTLAEKEIDELKEKSTKELKKELKRLR